MWRIISTVYGYLRMHLNSFDICFKSNHMSATLRIHIRLINMPFQISILVKMFATYITGVSTN